MSQENVESTERFLDAHNRRDFDVLAGLVTEAFEWVTTNAGLVESGSFRGRAGIEAYFADVDDTWNDYRLSAWEVRDLSEVVLAAISVEARGRSSGVAFRTQIWSVSDFRDGRCWRSRTFLDPGDALRVAGLTE
ncbi:MAG TPA: nuclear transport factor 2 family protein [Solirubrobacteraceae bacterium]|nr:nuclear transport factor 2 family protein [Solirubrobacteraceae bacterium]